MAATKAATSPTRGQARRDAILDAAAALVVELGYERVTVDAIAARAQASKATMYRLWPTKGALIAAALRRGAQGPGDVPIADTGTLRGDLVFQVAGIARSVSGDGDPSLVNLIEAVRTDALFRDLVRTQIEAASAQAGAALGAQAADRGEGGGTLDIAAALGVAVAQLLTTALLTGSSPTLAQQLRLVDDILLPLVTRQDPATTATS
ncbi:MAG: TetR/AcrR family transcriptional regulator [Nocardioides sp.]|nr:TetR/AcrR family transcriptional regulator [Nocardioides sp.]